MAKLQAAGLAAKLWLRNTPTTPGNSSRERGAQNWAPLGYAKAQNWGTSRLKRGQLWAPYTGGSGLRSAGLRLLKDALRASQVERRIAQPTAQ
jgi:hypothetical protein